MDTTGVKIVSHRSKRTHIKRCGFRLLQRALFVCALASTMVPFLLDAPDQSSHISKKGRIHAMDHGHVIVASVVNDIELSGRRAKPRLADNVTSHRKIVDSWSNDRGLVHVVYTRFMQHQPNLVALGLARLELFVTFCLPTIRRQTNQQFLWIIRTDPDLHKTLRDRLLQAVSGLPNVAVVGSNDVKKGSLDGGFRSDDAIGDITENSLFYGSIELVRSYHANSKLRSVLETNIDADDGIGLTFVESIQNMTHLLFKGKKRKNAWLNVCVGRHLEWQFYAPWDNATEKGSINLGSTHICITAGLSWATMRKADPEFEDAHHLIKKETRDCGTHHKAHLGCWEELPETDFMAIRSRTPTSTGMARVLTDESAWTKEEVAADESHWTILEDSFGISQTSIEKSRRYLADHLNLIVEENLKGQCQKDHSCSEGIKKKLKKILFKDNLWKNKYDLVHIVQTSLDSSLSLHVLDQFSFASLEAQTSYEFLWVIRLKELPEAQEEQMEDFLTSKVLGKSPLNILVVKSEQTPTLDFRNRQAISDITEDTLLYGEIAMLEDFHRAAQNRTLLETSLEPHDALSKTFVDELQSSAFKQLKESQLLEDANSWYYQCHSRYIGWNYFTPEGYDADGGFLTLLKSEDDDCFENPGTTRISLPGAQIPYFREVSSSECKTLVVLRVQDGCHIPVFTNRTLTARAIVPKSVEMQNPTHVELEDLEQLDEEDRHLRSVLRVAFDILPVAVETMRSRIQKMQCHDSQTCNPKWDSEYGVTHVVQTSVQNISDFLYWRYFCLSLEAQTTKKFLWIIRVNVGPEFVQKLLKTIKNIPLNVLVAQAASTPTETFRDPDSIADLRNQSLLYGDRNMLEYFHRSAQRRPLLETFLSPTVSLSKRFLSNVQKAVSLEAKERSGVYSQSGWYYRCVADVVEWMPHAPGTNYSGSLTRVDLDGQHCGSRPGATRISLPGTGVVGEELDMLLGQPCADSAGWEPNGCYATFQSGMKTARAQASESRVDNGGIEGKSPETISSEEENRRFESLQQDFGLFRMSLVHLVSNLNNGVSLDIPSQWENSKMIVHVIYTRFLQQQGTLLQLGNARMHLFQTICVPTVAAQTNKQFLWIVRTDPELLPKLKETLISTLSAVPNVLLVASDFGVDGYHDGGFRSNPPSDEFDETSVLLGDLNLLRSYHEASKQYMLVETNLDSDDGIAVTFVEQVQSKVSSLFESDRRGIGWIQLCIGRHLEWHFYSPWEKKSDKGCLLQGKTRSCIKSGMSWATQPQSKPRFMNALHNLKEYLPSCSLNRTIDSILYEGCWDEVELQDPENDVLALRVMSPASSGVARGEISKFDWGLEALLFDKTAWSLLDPYFSVRSEWIREVRQQITGNLSLVSADNERSKCTHEKTCAGKWKNAYRVVHVIHTELYDPNLADMLHRVSLSSLTRQTTYEFLWIIRVTDFTDYRLVLSMLGPLRKSSFADNILLVKSDTTPTLNFRSRDAFGDISEETILHGDISILNDYHEASQTRPLLETFLCPSEGLIRTFAEELQSSTVALLKNSTRASQENRVFYSCVAEYMDRSYFAPDGKEFENGFLKVIQMRGGECMQAPGITRISLPNTTIPSIPENHHAVRCKTNIDNFVQGCFIHMESAKTPALRIRLPVKEKERHGLIVESLEELVSQQRRFSLQLRLLYSVFPPNLREIQSIMEENDRQVVHIIHSSLRHKEEIITWRQFCVETLVSQSTQNYFWIIRTNFKDLTMVKSMSNTLKYNFRQPRNIVLVRSNFTPSVDFRSNDAIADVTEDTIVRGSLEELKNVHMAAQGRTVLETFLQPTDNLAKAFVANMQNRVVLNTKHDQMTGIRVAKDHGSGQLDAWYFYCNPRFIQWTSFGPRKMKLKRGFFREIESRELSSCFHNPALTRVSFPGSVVQRIVDFSKIKACSNERKNGCCSHFDESAIVSSRAVIPSLKADREKDYWLTMTEEETSKLEKQSIGLSNLLSQDFNVLPYLLETLTFQMEKIYCEKVGTCYSQYDSEFGIVHIVHTSLQDPKMFQIWRRFCFALESQSTNKFLWILRVVPDEWLIREVRKPIRKTPLHIIVAKSNSTLVLPFRSANAIRELSTDSILDGDRKLLKYFHDRAQAQPLLETFLPPTDALEKSFLLLLQNTTAEHLKRFQLEGDSWYYQCVPDYIEWSLHSPDRESEFGSLQVIVNDEQRCINNPGMSRVSLPGAKVPKHVSSDTHLCQADATIKKGCILPVSNQGPFAARVVAPGSLQLEQSNEIQTNEIQRHKRNAALVTKMKNDFAIPPMYLKQLRKKLISSMG